MWNIDRGREGEKIAKSFLEKEGYRIREINWRTGRAEVDIIAEKEEVVIFIEVKSRTNTRYGYPEKSVGKAKRKMLLYAAENYLLENHLTNEIRYDIISVLFGDPPEIDHFKDAIFPYEI